MYLEILFKVVGGLGLFLYGMDNMSKGMQKLAGQRLKKILAALTTNRFIAIVMGIFVTALVQSSSVSTVMTIGFVNASLLTLKQALGVILGANIGTTITGWILVLKIGKYGLPMAGAAAVSQMFMKSDKARTRALTIMGLGLIFFGLELMSDGLKPVRTMPEFVELFHAFSANSYLGVLKAAAVGALLTAVVQSSSATLGITITLAVQGLIDYPTAVALVLGENVGTTITALLASLGANANAKRAAYAHTIINVVGVLWATSIFTYYLAFLEDMMDPVNNLTAAIATAHTMFNVLNVLLFVPFIGYVADFLCKVVKDDAPSVKGRVTHLDNLMTETPAVVVEQTKTEVIEMGISIKKIFKKLKESVNSTEALNINLPEIEALEDRLDLFQKEISDVNFRILTTDLDSENTEETRENIQTCDEYETISDYLLRIAKTLKKLEDHEISLSDHKKNTLTNLHSNIESLFDDIDLAYQQRDRELFVAAIKKCNFIKDEYKKARAEHLEHITNSVMPAMLSTGYMDILNNYRRIKDHLYNIIEIFAKL
ncbi:MAG: Na/Pi cotransporter family protein [Cetobacterium sp.]|uniref:Na/Pi cotransporter family protein n=1 Tax=unclassified Cetobacterium TaxID=2630983 RepID=UPI00163C8C95|nr:Na/Pi cotransporter family protein [Cetobacterium sp. 2A]MBC2856662.1 Na/Pi cotransporter family protein [Cetobacterium sp. 2A]